MLEKLKVILSLIWLILIMIQTFLGNLSLHIYIGLSSCLMLFVMGLSEYKRDPDAFFPYFYFIFSCFAFLVTIFIFFRII